MQVATNAIPIGLQMLFDDCGTDTLSSAQAYQCEQYNRSRPIR